MLLDLCPIWPDLAWLLLGALAYAEMHYRWWPLPSRYFRREPEILADAPRRVGPGRAPAVRWLGTKPGPQLSSITLEVRLGVIRTGV